MKVKVLSDINSGEYKAGQVVEFADAQGQELVDAGAAKLYDPETDTETQPTESTGESQEATPPADPLPPTQPPVASASDQPKAPTTPAAPAVNPTAEQIAQDVASVESKSEV